MLFESWYFSLIRGIPEYIALVALGTAIVQIRLNIVQIVSAGTGAGLLVFLLLRLPIQYGIHIPLGIIIYIIILSVYLKIPIIKSASAALISFILLIFTETIVTLTQVNILGYSEEMIIQGTDLTKLLFSLPSLALLIVFSIIVQAWICFKARGTD